MLIAVGSDADFVASGGSFMSEEGLMFQSFAREDLCLDLTDHLLKNHEPGEDVGEAFLEFLWPQTEQHA